MRILVLGAGATGGYFGGRLLQAGRDVTFLVRPKRAAALATSGLVIKSPFGDARLDSPPTVLAQALAAPYDLILLSCKAYDLDDAVSAISPAVGVNTLILPLLNGMRHLGVLHERFGEDKVLGGRCVIAATLDEAGGIAHLNETHGLTFGERNGGSTKRLAEVAEVLCDAGFDAHASATIEQDMWEKWVMLASLAAGTCLMRAAIGVIVASPGGGDFLTGLFEECCAIATANGFAPREKFRQFAKDLLTETGSTLTASMLRDLEAGYRTEADHIIGDLLSRRGNVEARLLAVAYTHLKAHERSAG
ncbi:MAG: 2-dehydropantoate 2-reductase [Pseudomonadota bacterium]